MASNIARGVALHVAQLNAAKANPPQPEPAHIYAPPVAIGPPPSDVATSGLPIRGLFPPNLVLASDFSDTGKVLKRNGSGPVRSSVFPYPQAAPTNTLRLTTITKQLSAVLATVIRTTNTLSVATGAAPPITVTSGGGGGATAGGGTTPGGSGGGNTKKGPNTYQQA